MHAALTDPGYLSLFLVGLLGGTHCIGMCGGIVGALSLGGGARPVLHLAYNAGRIASYSLAGALAGLAGQAGGLLADSLPWRLALFFLANLTLVALGLYLLGVNRALAFAERFGQRLWRRLQPCTKRFLPARTVAQAFPLGLLWGWLPCGLVYGALVSALSAGSPLRGAGLMLSFGLGTLPTLLASGLLAVRLNKYLTHRVIRSVAGALVLSFGLHGLYAVGRMLLAA